MELLKVEKLNNAQNMIYEKCINSNFNLEKELIKIEDSINRILYEDIKSNFDVPSFRRSTVDGYAVLSKDIAASSESIPSFLNVIGESKMGEECFLEIKPGECAYVPTGGMLPKNADAVVMVEYVENFAENKIAVYNSVSSGTNVVNIGDDNKKGDILLKKGKKITPQDIGLLSSNGVKEVYVYRTFNISIISTGDEIVDINSQKNVSQIYDINSYSIYAECRKNLFNVKGRYLLKDDIDILRATIKKEMEVSDIIVVSGGSSKGKKDNTAKVMDELASSKLMVHGIAVKPGKPTIISYDENTKTVLIGLPGHPVAAFILFKLLVENLYEKLTSCISTKIKVRCQLTENIMQSPGRTTFQLVNIDENYNASLVLGKSGLINTLSKADGYVVIEENCEGINTGEEVDVYLL